VGAEAPNVSIVFQSFALFPWLTVIENVEAPLEARGVPEVERHKRALRIIDEPFSALDVLTAETLRGELLELWLGKQIPTRAIFVVTHNIEEAVLLAD